MVSMADIVQRSETPSSKSMERSERMDVLLCSLYAV